MCKEAAKNRLCSAFTEAETASLKFKLLKQAGATQLMSLRFAMMQWHLHDQGERLYCS